MYTVLVFSGTVGLAQVRVGRVSLQAVSGEQGDVSTTQGRGPDLHCLALLPPPPRPHAVRGKWTIWQF